MIRLSRTLTLSALAILASLVGIVVAGAFTLRAIQVAFFGSTGAPASSDAAHAHPLPTITLAEKSGALLLLAATLFVGLKPDVLLDWIVPALQSPAFQAVIKGGTP